MKQVNEYIEETFCTHDILREEVIASIQANEMPSISVSSASGKVLTMLVSISDATSVLEIGALGGYSGICLAKGFSDKGHLTSLELKEEYAEVARQNLEKAGFGDRVTYMTGEALGNLDALIDEEKRFDFFFIDADKGNYKNYLERCLRLAVPGAIIVADNVLAGGSLLDDTKKKRYTETMREFNDHLATHPQLESLLIPLGDGLTVSIVKE